VYLQPCELLTATYIVREYKKKLTVSFPEQDCPSVPLNAVIVVDDDDDNDDDSNNNNNVPNYWLRSLCTFPCRMKGKTPDAKI
jgi:hypothetical protein